MKTKKEYSRDSSSRYLHEKKDKRISSYEKEIEQASKQFYVGLHNLFPDACNSFELNEIVSNYKDTLTRIYLEIGAKIGLRLCADLDVSSPVSKKGKIEYDSREEKVLNYIYHCRIVSGVDEKLLNDDKYNEVMVEIVKSDKQFKNTLSVEQNKELDEYKALYYDLIGVYESFMYKQGFRDASKLISII